LSRVDQFLPMLQVEVCFLRFPPGFPDLLDVDIKGYFDRIDHKWLMRMLKERIVDRTILRLIGKWLKVGVLEETSRKSCSLMDHEEGSQRGYENKTDRVE